MRAIAANALTLLIVAAICIAGVVGYGVNLYRADGPLAAPTTYEVPRGASLDRVAEGLEGAGVIESASIFRLGAHYEGKSGAIRFGEYEIPARASMAEVLRLLVEGDTIQHSFTIAEGLTSWEIVEKLREVEVLTGEVETIPAEGALAPDTYFVARGDTRQAVLERMAREQARRLQTAWAGRAADLPISSPQEALVLASIIEKETGLAEERPLVGGVFVNRLRRGMKLQSDPTIVYGITRGQGPLDRPIRRSDITARTDWNTYVIDALPPTPIANPGLEAIRAATKPAATEALFFVADGTGGHAFANTLAEHNKNVRKWRRIEAERARQ